MNPSLPSPESKSVHERNALEHDSLSSVFNPSLGCTSFSRLIESLVSPYWCNERYSWCRGRREHQRRLLRVLVESKSLAPTRWRLRSDASQNMERYLSLVIRALFKGGNARDVDHVGEGWVPVVPLAWFTSVDLV